LAAQPVGFAYQDLRHSLLGFGLLAVDTRSVEAQPLAVNQTAAAIWRDVFLDVSLPRRESALSREGAAPGALGQRGPAQPRPQKSEPTLAAA
jgi:hypothetical protein